MPDKPLSEYQQIDCLRELVNQGGGIGGGEATAANQATQITAEQAILAAVTGATPAGTAIIGKFGIDQTTPGTTNLVASAAKQFTASSNATVGTADGTIATLTAGQRLLLQNLDNDELYVKYGASASTSSFTFIIPACTAANDGTVPPFLIDNWIGVVSVKAESDTAPRYLATVLS